VPTKRRATAPPTRFTTKNASSSLQEKRVRERERKRERGESDKSRRESEGESERAGESQGE
jgi:hypothetical protein